MKVKDLIEGLKNYYPELKVICPKDDEGNGYVTCYMPSAAYSPDLYNHWIEDVYTEGLSLDDYCEDNELDKPPAFNCVVL